MLPKKKDQAARPQIGAAKMPLRQTAAQLHQRYSRLSQAVSCLVRVLGHHGLKAPPDEIRARLTASPSDNDVINFLDVAELFGLTGRPMVLTVGEWRTLPAASILHWGADDLVVFDSYQQDTVVVHDPIRGLRQVDMVEFRRQFTGVALVFDPLLVTPPPRD
jgi:ATP-binding cassette subfamily B protein RaxB